MNVQWHLLLMVALAATVIPASGQQAVPEATPANIGVQASIPDFSGIWRHGNLPWFIPPASGPGPVTNLSRTTDTGVSDYSSLVGDYKNPILQAWAAGVVKKKGELSLAGVVFPNPANTCWPEPVPFLFKHAAMQMLQLPGQIVMLFNEGQEVRRVRMNQPHPTKVTPSWHGDSVGHYEGDTLVIDTVGMKVGPFAMVDMYGTPFTEKLHVVERYRLVDYDEAKDAIERNRKENFEPPGYGGAPYDRNDRGKVLQLHFTVEDEGVFTTPWTSTITYRRSTGPWTELICAEHRREYYADKDSEVPHAEKPDF